MKNNNISLYVLLILIAFSWSSCSSDEDQDNDTICAPNDFYYLLITDRDQCFAERFILNECIEISASANNLTSSFCKETPEGIHYLFLPNSHNINEDGWGDCNNLMVWDRVVEDIFELGENDCLLRSTGDSYEYPHWGCIESAVLITDDGTSCFAQDYPLEECVIYNESSFNNVATQKCFDSMEGTLYFHSGNGHIIGSPDWYDCHYCINDTVMDNCCTFIP